MLPNQGAKLGVSKAPKDFDFVTVVLNQQLLSFHTRKALEFKSCHVGTFYFGKVFNLMQTWLASFSGVAFSDLRQ